MDDNSYDFDNDDELDKLMDDARGGSDDEPMDDDNEDSDALPEEGSSSNGRKRGRENEDNGERRDKHNKSSSDDDDKDDKSSMRDKLDPKKALARKAVREVAKGGALAGGAVLAVKATMHLAKMMIGKLITALKSALNAILTAIVNLGATVATAIGTSLAVGIAAVVSGPVFTIIAIATIAVVYVNEETQRIGGLCVASTLAKEFYEEMDSVLDGDEQAVQRGYVEKMYSVMSSYGLSISGVAAMAGNFQVESGIDPTGVETIYGERHRIGPRKEFAESVGYDVAQIDADYASRYGLIKLVGIGLGQWTDTNDGARGNTQLRAFADKIGKKWYEFDTQMAFILQETGMRGNAMAYLKSDEGRAMTVAEATAYFLKFWEGNRGDKLDARTDAAKVWAIALTEMTVDTNYADSILSDANATGSDVNSAIGKVNQSDGCGSKVGSTSKGVPDGTGVVPSDLGGMTTWSRDNLPASLKPYTHDPEKAGLGWGNGANWSEVSGQCVPFSNSYMMLLYSKKEWLLGNGHAIAGNFAKIYGGELTSKPQQGAVFSLENDYSGGAGHTGIVEHVFANGDFLIVESNVPGTSGDGLGQSLSQRTTWSWRLIRSASLSNTSGPGEYNWRFFKPNEEPKWNGGSK